MGTNTGSSRWYSPADGGCDIVLECNLRQVAKYGTMTAGRLDAGGVWDLEDEEALAAARTLIEQYSDIGYNLPD
jgi:hypothetical protein